MTYIPEQYWHERGMNYVAPGEMEEIPEVDNLKKLLLKHNLLDMSILEVGSGYGRIYNELHKMLFVTKPLNFTMCDFVESMRHKCLRATDILPEKWDGKELPYNDNEFELVISFSVLLHVPPCDIEQVLSEHVRVTNKYIFIATYAGGLEKLAPHCFEHDYLGMFERLGLKIVSYKTFQKGLRVNWLVEV